MKLVYIICAPTNDESMYVLSGKNYIFGIIVLSTTYARVIFNHVTLE